MKQKPDWEFKNKSNCPLCDSKTEKHRNWYYCAECKQMYCKGEVPFRICSGLGGHLAQGVISRTDVHLLIELGIKSKCTNVMIYSMENKGMTNVMYIRPEIEK